MYTVQEIENSTSEMLTPAQAAKVLGCDAQTLRIQAKIHPEKLGFPVSVIGTRVRIPRVAFLKFLKGAEKNGMQ